MTTVKGSVFLSHSAVDSEYVARLQRLLKAAFPGIAIFVSSSSESILPGDVWWDRIREELLCSAIVIACISRASADRPWVLFESGVALGLGRPLVPVILDDLPMNRLSAPLSLFQAIILDGPGAVYLVNRVSAEIGMPSVQAAALPASMVQRASRGNTAPGFYVGRKRLDMTAVWPCYGGDPRSFKPGRDFVSIGSSFSDAFRFPPADTLTAPWRHFGFRALSPDGIHVYAILRLNDQSLRTVFLSTSLGAWGYTGNPRDEYRVPLGDLPKHSWTVVIFDVGSIEPDLPAAPMAIAGIRVRGPLLLSHVWCLDSRGTLPVPFRRNLVNVAYPRT